MLLTKSITILFVLAISAPWILGSPSDSRPQLISSEENDDDRYECNFFHDDNTDQPRESQPSPDTAPLSSTSSSLDLSSHQQQNPESQQQVSEHGMHQEPIGNDKHDDDQDGQSGSSDGASRTSESTTRMPAPVNGSHNNHLPPSSPDTQELPSYQEHNHEDQHYSNPYRRYQYQIDSNYYDQNGGQSGSSDGASRTPEPMNGMYTPVGPLNYGGPQYYYGGPQYYYGGPQYPMVPYDPNYQYTGFYQPIIPYGSYTGQPGPYTGQPTTYTGRPDSYTGQLVSYTGQPGIYTGQPGSVAVPTKQPRGGCQNSRNGSCNKSGAGYTGIFYGAITSGNGSITINSTQTFSEGWSLNQHYG